MAENGGEPKPLVGAKATAALVGAVLAALISGVTLLFTLFPEWRPDPRERADASVLALAFDRNVTQRDYYHRVGAVPEACTEEQLRRFGNVVYLQADAAGFKRSEVGLRWYTYDANNGRRVPGVRSNNSETTVFRPRASVNRQVAQVWVPTPLQGGTYFIRFELYGGGVLRAFVDTEPFDVAPPLPDAYKGAWCKPLRGRNAG